MPDRRDRHLSTDLLARCLVGLGDRQENRRVVRHLLTGCERCRKLTVLTFTLAALRDEDILPAGPLGEPPFRMKIARRGEALLFTCQPANAKNQ